VLIPHIVAPRALYASGHVMPVLISHSFQSEQLFVFGLSLVMLS
jgi:hypothetical protein